MRLHRPRAALVLCLWSILSFGYVSVVPAETVGEKDIQITRVSPDPRGGQAYRLTYSVPLPLEILWRFKTDFDNQFLESNKYILKHRLISSRDNVVVTEDIYSSNPSERFHWQTRIFADHHRLEFKLLESKAHNHKFHYGIIQLQDAGESTRVTQTAFFDFFGASLWAAYPWAGGMQTFLKYTANWERETAVRMRHHYTISQPKKR